MIDFITATHDHQVLQANLLNNDFIQEYSIKIQAGFTNIPEAYNKAEQTSPISIFIHHDVYLPARFQKQLLDSLGLINCIDNNWGVLGVAGVTLVNGKKEIHGNILDRGRLWGQSNDLPHAVDTLDELLLITHGDLKFDENLTQDFYGADICMQAKVQGRKNYAINAFCHHNSTREFGGRTENFYKCESYFREKWKDHLPIATTCTIVS